MNYASGDGCSSLCRLETGWLCLGGGTSPGETDSCYNCGNSKREAAEACDDGVNNGAGC